MDLNQFNEKLERQFDEHPDRMFVIKSLFLVLLIILGKICLGSWLIPILSVIFINFQAWQCVISGKGIRRSIWENISFLSVPRTNTRDRMTGTAWVTWSIIILNVLIFFSLEFKEPEFVANNLICLPYAPTLINYPLSFLTSMYLHADIYHLFGNMTFLWAFGTIVERRIGCRRFLAAYHITGLLGGALFVIVHAGILSEDAHALGASGAIAGIMGIYIVRCYFKKMIAPLPIFGFLPININIQMNAFVVIGLFFALNLQGGFSQLLGSTESIGYWAHLGGLAGGLWIACRMKLSNEAIEERHRELGSSLIDGNAIVSKAFDEVGGFANAEKSLLIALEKNPHNTDTIVALARLHSYLKPSEAGCNYYRQALHLMLTGKSPEITSIFREFFSKYRKTIDAVSQYRVASLLYREGDYDLASRTMEMLVDQPDTPEPFREKAMLLSAKLLDKLSLHEAALVYYKRFIESYPASALCASVLVRLETLQG
jgi:membrane associated rhomboid family serine protease